MGGFDDLALQKKTETQPKISFPACLSFVCGKTSKKWPQICQGELIFSLCVLFHLNTLCIINSHTINALESADGWMSEYISLSVTEKSHLLVFVCVCVCVWTLKAHLLVFSPPCVCVQMYHRWMIHTTHILCWQWIPKDYTVLLPEGFPVNVSLCKTVTHELDKNLNKMSKILRECSCLRQDREHRPLFISNPFLFANQPETFHPYQADRKHCGLWNVVSPSQLFCNILFFYLTIAKGMSGVLRGVAGQT